MAFKVLKLNMHFWKVWGVGAHDVPGEGAQGHGVALQLEASHREAGRGHGALAVGAHGFAQRPMVRPTSFDTGSPNGPLSTGSPNGP